MARLIGPSEASREVKTIVATNGSTKGLFKSKATRPATFYLDQAGTQLADILLADGSPVVESTVTVDAYSMLPLIQFPDGVDTLYVVVDGGPAWPVYAREDDQFDVLEARMAALEPGGSSAALAKSANLSDVASPSTARTNLGLGTAATKNVGTTSSDVAAGDAPAAAQAAAISAAATDATTKADAAQSAAISAAATDATSKANSAQSAAISAAATDATTKANAAQSAAISAAATDATTKANSAQATAVQRANHTGTQSADTLTDGTTNVAFLATERTKLAGVATGATANATDAQLRDRSTHTGAQATSTITGLDAALAAKVSVLEAPLTPLRYGAVGDGTTNDDAAFTALWAALPAVGGHVYLPSNYNFLLTTSLPLHNSLRIEGGDRRKALITNKVTSVFTGASSISDLHLHDFGVIAGLVGTSSGGHILDFSTAGLVGPYCSSFHNLYLQQNRADKSVLYVPGGQYLDNQFYGCQTYGYNRSVPAFYLRSTTGSLGDNLFADIRHTDDGTPTTWALWLEEFSGTSALGNTVERVNFENPAGGAICLRGQNGAVVRQIWLWDMATTSTNHGILLEKVVSGQPNTGVTIEGVARPSGTLGSGKSDIFSSVGHAFGTTIRRCITDGSQALRVDMGFNIGTSIEDCYGSGVSLQSWTFTTTIGAGAGTGAVVNSKAGNFYEGNVTINSGTSPAAGVIVSVGWPNGVRTAPAAVTLTPMTTSAYDAGLYVTNLTTTGFDVATKNAVAASTSGIKFCFEAKRTTTG